MSFFNNGSNYNESNYTWKGDFLGFTLGGVHSSILGIVRVSDNNRYDEDLLPNYQDITANVPGRNETYYFGSTYTQREFTVKIAYDHLTDSQLRKLKQLLSKKEPQDLIFDEAPYKVYSVKCKDKPSLSYLCFDEDYHRIYKGEGTINFIAYFPFARSRYKYIEDYNAKNIPEWGGIEDNKMEWLESSGLISNIKKYNIILPDIVIDGVDQGQGATSSFSRSLDEIDQSVWRSKYAVLLSNFGDMTTPLKFTIGSYHYDLNTLSYQIFLREIDKSDDITFSYEDSSIIGYMKITIPNNRIFRRIDDSGWWNASSKRPIYLLFDGYNRTVIPYYYKPNSLADENNDENPETENILYGGIRNDIIVAGDFFDLPPNDKDKIYLLHIDPITKYNDNLEYAAYLNNVEYDYLYY